MSGGGESGRLRLRQAVSMAVGGMIGGGIFSVLGVVIQLAGHLAVASFLVGGALALVTAHSYSRLTLAHDRAGGSFAFLRQADHPAAAGWLAWLLVLGYVFTMSVYAFTFGHYLANVVGIDELFARVFGVAIIVVFVAVNLRGVTTSGLVEDLTVLGKVLILALVAAIGIARFSTERLSPLADQGLVGLFVGASVIFMAYEGFQLLAYDYDELDQPHRNLPRALYLSVPAVIAVYLVVTVGAQMLVPDRTIVEQKEVALATVGKEALGTSGLVLVTVAAVFSTGSAINATLFATARLARDVGSKGEFPQALAKERGAVPWSAVVVLGVLAALFSLMPGIVQIVAFGSLTFLVVFAAVNALHARVSAEGVTERAVAYAGSAGCTLAVLGLLYYLATEELLALLVIGICLALLLPSRLAFLHARARS